MAPRSDRPKRDCTCVHAKHVHGTYAAYNADGCGCTPCRDAANQTRDRNRRVEAQVKWGTRPPIYTDSTGTGRRLQALAFIGWTADQLAMHCGQTAFQLQKLRQPASPTVRLETALVIARVYDELWDRPQKSTSSLKCAATARRMGYKPPMWWDDDTIDTPLVLSEHGTHARYMWDKRHKKAPCVECERAEREYQAEEYRRRKASAEQIDEVAVQRAIGGDHRVRLSITERVEAVKILTRRGYSSELIAQRIGCAQRTVDRILARIRAEAVPPAAGDIGENPNEYEFEPLHAPAVPEPIQIPAAPEPVREPEKVPA